MCFNVIPIIGVRVKQLGTFADNHKKETYA